MLMLILIHEIGRIEDGKETACDTGSLENRPTGRWIGMSQKGRHRKSH